MTLKPPFCHFMSILQSSNSFLNNASKKNQVSRLLSSTCARGESVIFLFVQKTTVYHKLWPPGTSAEWTVHLVSCLQCLSNSSLSEKCKKTNTKQNKTTKNKTKQIDLQAQTGFLHENQPKRKWYFYQELLLFMSSDLVLLLRCHCY